MLKPAAATVTIRLWLLGITLGKISVFLVLVSFLHVHPFVGDNTKDYFIPIAERINSQGSFNDIDSRDYSSVPPGYPFFLAGIYRLAPRSPLIIVVCLQFLADLLIGVALLRLGSRFGGVRAGGVAAVLWLLFPPALVISTWITPETLFDACVMWVLVLLSVHDVDLRSLRMVSAGLLLGLATLIRSNTLFLPVAFVAYWFWRRSYSAAMVFALAFVLPIGAWTVRNRVVLGDPIVVSTSFGSAFMQGSDDKFYQHKATEYPALMRGAEAAGLTRPTVETGSNMNRWMFRIGMRNYRLRLEKQGIFAVLGHFGRKLGYMWFLTESGNLREEAVLSLCSLVVVPLGFWGLWTWWLTGEAQRILVITVAFWIGIHLLVVPVARYMVPVLPVILLAACIRVETLLSRKGLLPDE